MRLTLPEPDIPEEGGFTPENDIFGYKEFGERLANLVSNINEPLVITLDGTWGSGKSVFIKQWAGLMRKEHDGSVVYFDAFANDFHSDAFMALAAEIYSIAKGTLDENNPFIRGFLDDTKKAVRVLASKGTDIALRLGTAGNVNLKDIEDMLEVFENESEEVISKQLQKVDEERKSLQAFRDSLSRVSKSIAKSIAEKNQDAGQSLPLVFIVDELDRCRPSFALEILEHIKHLFSVENVCFVLVTNLTQMEAIIEKTYGAKTKARKYLEKFYHLKIVLPELKTDDQKQCDKYLSHLWNNLNLVFEADRLGQLVHKEIRFLVDVHELSLREIKQVMTNVVLAVASATNDPLFIPPVVAGLCVMRQKYPGLYARARQNNLTIEDVKKFLKIDDSRYGSREGMADERYRVWVLERWQFFVDPDAPKKVIDEASSITRYYSLSSRLSLLPILTNYIDNLPTPPSHSS